MMIDPAEPNELDWRGLKIKQRQEMGINAIKEIFRGDQGLKAFQHLKEKFDRPAHVSQIKDGVILPLDPIMAAVREGQRNVFEYIESIVVWNEA